MLVQQYTGDSQNEDSGSELGIDSELKDELYVEEMLGKFIQNIDTGIDDDFTSHNDLRRFLNNLTRHQLLLIYNISPGYYQMLMQNVK